ncbi:unnamed protein product [[Candida] boidinii]|nr:unnamed protein product [[Candida] boidinii]
MLTFCPYCGNMLVVSKSDSTQTNAFTCSTCPYEFPVVGLTMFERKELLRKQVDDVLGGEGAWDNVDQTATQCPVESCGFDKAYFFQLQIRSADEPMTTFYKCCKCSHQWREN